MGGNSFRPASVIQVFMTTYDALSKIAKTATTMIPHEHTPSPRIGNAIIIYVRDSVLDKIFARKTDITGTELTGYTYHECLSTIDK